MKTFFNYFFSACCLLFSVCSYASDPVLNKIDKQILNSLKNGEQNPEYIIYLKEQAKIPNLRDLSKKEKGRIVFKILQSHAKTTQVNILTILKRKNAQYKPYYAVNAIWAKTNVQTMMDIAALDEVGKIIYNPWVRMDMPEEDRVNYRPRNPEPEWGIRKIKADSVWQMGFTGQGITIAGQDTGYEWELSPLKSKYRGFTEDKADHNYHWHDAITEANPRFPETNPNPCGLAIKAPCDDNNHGTHTMGTMVGKDDENLIGVAPDAKWIACRNMDRGWGKPSTYMDCFEFFLAPYDLEGKNPNPDMAPHVINNSWGCPEEEGCNPSNWALMEQLVNNLNAAGVVVVVSAGNSGSQGCGSIDTPAPIFESSFTVGSTRQDDAISGFSSRGPVVVDSSYRMKPDVVAPGSGVRSVIRGGLFASYSGTSMAGPHVAGLVALIISANPELEGRVDEIEEIIRTTAVPFTSNLDCFDFPGSDIPNPTFGWGRVDALAAVRKAMEFTSSVKNVLSENEIKCFPNPGTGVFRFVIENEDVDFSEIRIFDHSGRLIHSLQNIQNQKFITIDISPSPSGMFFYTFLSNKKSYSGKFIKL